jgi:RNA polymerase sigma factor (sigma-70 family)
MDDTRTTLVVQRFLNELAGVKGDVPAEPIVRALLASAVDRLHLLCTTLLFRNYPRLTRPPLNLQADEMLSSVVERLLKAMRQVHPQTVRQFFALANQHIRWELNDLARRLDKEARLVTLRESLVGAPPDSSGSQPSPNTGRILEAIENLPEEEREVFDLVRIQGMSQPEAAEVLGVSTKTVQRRLVRCLTMLTEKIGDLRPAPDSKNPA